MSPVGEAYRPILGDRRRRFVQVGWSRGDDRH